MKQRTCIKKLFYDKFWLAILGFIIDEAEILTSEVHDPYARTTGAWK